MCHMFLLNVEFSNACRFRISSVTFRKSRVFHSHVFGRPNVDTDRVLEVARIFTKHSKCCDKFFVLTMSLYAFMSLFFISRNYSTRC